MSRGTVRMKITHSFPLIDDYETRAIVICQYACRDFSRPLRMDQIANGFGMSVRNAFGLREGFVFEPQCYYSNDLITATVFYGAVKNRLVHYQFSVSSTEWEIYKNSELLKKGTA